MELNYQFIKSTKDDIQMAVGFIIVITPLNIILFKTTSSDIWSKFELIKDIIVALVTAKIKKI